MIKKIKLPVPKGKTREEIFGKEKADLWKKRQRDSAIGKKHTEVSKRKIGGFQKGKKLKQETKDKISIATKGVKKSQSMKDKLRLANLGKKMKQETKDKLGVLYNGKTYEEIHGIEKANKIKSKLSIKTSGKNNPMYGRTGKKCPAFGKKRTKGSIEKFKKFRKKQILPVKDTSIEIKIQNFLKQLGIEFFTHQYIKIEHGYQCDILIPSMNLVIECDGDYWHKYPVGNDIDHIRTSELIAKGFRVLRLWEFEIREMDFDKFRGKIKSFL